ncbi:hypothetical protein AVEN_7330-1 [Araneus ventricosus]|uniref:Uncharacterized protein n=1 Tax=Araneus ventricosus TaxID=182803 RepID=A0A4Y2BQ58_ARAVE|nr:hypothetical protein AVEN_7330-1 [Araneus ventricosus]
MEATHVRTPVVDCPFVRIPMDGVYNFFAHVCPPIATSMGYNPISPLDKTALRGGMQLTVHHHVNMKYSKRESFAVEYNPQA